MPVLPGPRPAPAGRFFALNRKMKAFFELLDETVTPGISNQMAQAGSGRMRPVPFDKQIENRGDEFVCILGRDDPEGWLIARRRWRHASNAKGVARRLVAGIDWAQPCLLYTSPSPRDGLLSRMPSSA